VAASHEPFTYPANPSLFFGFVLGDEFLEQGTDADEPSQKQTERLILSSVVLPEEIQQPDGGGQMPHHGGRIGGVRIGRANREGPRQQMPGALPRQMELALQVFLGDLDLAQRHIGGAMAEQFHQRRHTDAGAQHAGRIAMAAMPHAA